VLKKSLRLAGEIQRKHVRRKKYLLMLRWISIFGGLLIM